ncbi:MULTISPECIES: hypothetical protein [unclassified Chryseobacterium]|uniref:hypothetical protein n=1 Tax=unclassified Chryseobacterium TaxID=2593645 RepID=UPI001B7CB4B1|nr:MULTISPECIES: hypothetical protein [unclassified Chryseobacterium]MBP1165618.1 hypothetical protein [Chryseobacterium sp. PvR013]MDR4894449.1 hypothetical protein [Chryseobacterium sp. CFS7]
MRYFNIKTQNKDINLTYIVFPILCLFISACKNRNYILYYNKVNEIDSIYRTTHQPEETIKQYRKLFRKYHPKNQERIKEYETYIKLADQHHKNFGGKKGLYKLVPLIAPYEGSYGSYFGLFQRYGIDSTEVKQRIADWKKGLNKILVDSFSIAFTRDQAEGRRNFQLMKKNDRINAQLLKWTFENYGYPSVQKIGLIGNDGVFMPMHPLFSHMAGEKEYPYFKAKMLEYIKSGDCIPKDYANMVDRHNLQISKEGILYGMYLTYDAIVDTIKANQERKKIGIPSIQHSSKITKDYFKK